MQSIECELLRDGVLASVERYPHRPALFVGGRTWTYRELDRTARCWASLVVKHSYCAGTRRIGVLSSRSELSYIAPLACLYAGGTFVPLNPMLPVERIKFIIRECRLDVLFFDLESAAGLSEIAADAEIPLVLLADANGLRIRSPGLPTIDPSVPLCSEGLPILVDASVDDFAYIIYTSGSTGAPKGVPITQRNIVYFLTESQKRYTLSANDRFSMTFEQSFDPSIFDLFLAWWSGACAYCLRPIDLLSPFRFIRENQITWWNSVPSVAMLLHRQRLLAPNSLPSLRWSLFGGEVLSVALAQAWQDAAPNSVVENIYGPTELTIACASYRWHSELSPRECCNGTVPIGRLHRGLEYVIVDDLLEPVQEGVVGELCVAGQCVFPGYLGDNEATRGRLFHHRLLNNKEVEFYRTGDQVRMLPSGNLEFLCRKDRQVKINGYRLDLGEIENVLLRQPNVAHAVALSWPPNERSEGIIAFVSGDNLNTDFLAAALRAVLPFYMIPKRIVATDAMPLNLHGKIDQGKLSSLLEY